VHAPNKKSWKKPRIDRLTADEVRERYRSTGSPEKRARLKAMLEAFDQLESDREQGPARRRA